MKDIAEIIQRAISLSPDEPGSSGLYIIRELSKQERLAEMPALLRGWFVHEPNSRAYVLGNFPATILNNYIYKVQGLSSASIESYMDRHGDWADGIRSGALDAKRLVTTVNNFVSGAYQIQAANHF